MVRRARDILERAVHTIAEQAANTNKVIDEAMDADLAADHPVTLQAKLIRLELLKVKADLERELGRLVLNLHPVPDGVVLGPGHQHGRH